MTASAVPAGTASPVRSGPETEAAGDQGPRRSAAADLFRLLVGIALVITLGYAIGDGETVLIILALVLCIVAHEFGHFIAAKTGRVKVTEFFVGFGPRLWSVRRGETEYGVKAIPLGGYCRIIGMNNLEEVDPGDEGRTYRAAPLWRRLLIDVAGSSVHFLIALVVLFAMFFWTGDDGHYIATVPPDQPIAQILTFSGTGSPAQAAGLRVGDRIESIDGKHFASWDSEAAFIRSHAGDRLALTVLRSGRVVPLVATPIPADTIKGAPAGLPGGKAGVLGISPSLLVHSSFTASVSRAGGAWVQATAFTFDGLGGLVTLHGLSGYVHSLTSQKAAANDPNRLVSVVGLPSVLHQAAENGLASVLWAVALINLSLGILNLLPLFPLDGGRVVVALYEGVRSWRRPYRVDMAKLLPVMYTGLAVLAFFALGSMFIDLRSTVGG